MPTTSILWRAISFCPSNPILVSIISPSPLLSFVPWVSIDPFRSYNFFCRLMPISYTRSMLWRVIRFFRYMDTSMSISSSPSHQSCPKGVHWSVQELEFYRILSKLMHTYEGHKFLSVEWTPPTLVSISSSPSPLSAKLCPMSVHRSVQELELYRLFSRLMPTSYDRSIL